MIVLDNSVLSAYTRLGILKYVQTLFEEVVITKEVFEEYTLKWAQQMPNSIKVISTDFNLPHDLPFGLSSADYSNIILSKTKNCKLASDDLTLRKYAKEQNILITGSIGILKALKIREIIKTDEEYQTLLNRLIDDVYITDDLRDWANEF